MESTHRKLNIFRYNNFCHICKTKNKNKNKINPVLKEHCQGDFAVSGHFCAHCLVPLLAHKMLLQNYEGDIKMNLAGRAIFSRYSFKNLANVFKFQSITILAIRNNIPQ